MSNETKRDRLGSSERPIFARSIEEALGDLGVDPRTGLSEAEADRRLEMFGPNRLPEAARRSAAAILGDQFRSVIVALLAGAMALSIVTTDWLEAGAIAAVIVINATIGFVSELRAVRSMEALRRLSGMSALVRRGGAMRRVASEELVTGDIVAVADGDVVGADLRVTEANTLRVDESMLTGESVPVDKRSDVVADAAPLAERTSMLYSGTSIVRGAGEGVVAATAAGTELGQIAAMVDTAESDDRTPLELRLQRLGRRLVVLTAAITVLVAITGILSGQEPLLIVQTAIALAVAAIPEGLPIVATLALARGMWRMAQRRALVNRLNAVETLGSTNVICTDKTGTLTENQMTVRHVVTAEGETQIGGAPFGRSGDFQRGGASVEVSRDAEVQRVLTAGALCNDAAWERDAGGEDRVRAGEPMDLALVVAAVKAGIEPEHVRRAAPRLRELAFDPDIKMMATFHQDETGVRVAIKGAPEAVLPQCTGLARGKGAEAFTEAARAAWLERNQALAGRGLRVLAVAERRVEHADRDPYGDLTLLGLVGFVDPPRADVAAAIAACRRAGVRVVLVTGDQAPTARYVARAVGLPDDGRVVEGSDLASIEPGSPEEHALLDVTTFARVSPRQKLELVGLFQRHGNIVAMTGDGVNDAPALKCADIGIAMGQRGTQVAREAADVVLRDDSFASIEAAIAQGRVIFDNIRAFIRYLVSCNISEILVVFAAAIAHAPLPLLPLQILFLNLVTDVFPALALGLGEGDRRVMDRAPRDPGESMLTRGHWIGIGAYGVTMTASVLGALALALHWLHLEEPEAVTISFLTLACAQLWHVFDMRAPGSGLLRNEVTTNPYVWVALVICVPLVLASVWLPGLSDALGTVPPDRRGWLVVGAMSAIPIVLGQVSLLVRRGWAGQA